jgi:hypothetical protein
MSGSIWNMKLGETTAIELTANRTYDSSPTWSPDGRWMVYTAEDDRGVNLMLLNMTTGESAALTSGDGLNLALGTERHWLASGKPVGIADAPTHFGSVSYQMQYDSANSQVGGEATFAENSAAAWSVLHIRLPDGLRVKSVNAESKAVVLPDGSGIRWTAPRGTLKFQAIVGD